MSLKGWIFLSQTQKFEYGLRLAKVLLNPSVQSSTLYVPSVDRGIKLSIDEKMNIVTVTMMTTTIITCKN